MQTWKHKASFVHFQFWSWVKKEPGPDWTIRTFFYNNAQGLYLTYLSSTVLLLYPVFFTWLCPSCLLDPNMLDFHPHRDALHAVVWPCFVSLRAWILRTNQQSHTHWGASMGGPTGLAGRLSPSERSALLWDYMKAREITTSVWSSETKLIYYRTQHRSSDLAEHHLRLKDESKTRPPTLLFHFPCGLLMASGEGLVPGLLRKALPSNELMQRKSLTCIRHPRSKERN